MYEFSFSDLGEVPKAEGAGAKKHNSEIEVSESLFLLEHFSQSWNNAG